MKIYELYIILNPNLKEEELDSFSARLSGEMSKNGFGITFSQIKFNERLTHKISRFRQGHILDLEVSCPENKIFPEEIDKNLLHNENVLRHFIYSKSEKMIGKAKQFPNFEQIKMPRPEKKFAPIGEISSPAEPRQETQKVNIEEVDKKLEELLK